MLIWGSRSESKDLGQAETKPCPTCERDRPFHLHVQYRLHHVWYLFKWVTGRQYLRLCEVCHRGTEVPAASLAPAVTKTAVPLYHRFSWALPVPLVAIGVVFGILDDQQRAGRNAELIAAPRSGDLYATDISRLVRGGDDKYRFGVMKIKSIAGANVEFVLPRANYNKITAATRDMSSESVGKPDYFSTSAVQVPIADLKELQDKGVIHSIRRE